MESEDVWATAARPCDQAKRVRLVGDGIFDNLHSEAILEQAFWSGENWRTFFAVELEAPLTRARLRVHARGVDPAVPAGEIDLIIGFNDRF